MVTEEEVRAAKDTAEGVASRVTAVLQKAGLESVWPMCQGDTTVRAEGVISMGRPDLDGAELLIARLEAMTRAEQWARRPWWRRGWRRP